MLSNDVGIPVCINTKIKSLLSGKWFGSSNSSNIENFYLKNRQNITLRASLAKDLKFFINNELIDYSEHPCNSQFDIDPKSGKKWPATQFILMSTTL